MTKTTLYLPEDLKSAVERTAAAKGCSMADVVRDALRAYTAASEPPAPRLPLFHGADPTLAERVDQALAGFGER